MEDQSTPPEEPAPKAPKRLKQLLLLPARTSAPLVQRLFRNKWLRVGVIALVALPLIGWLAWWGWSNSSLSKLSVDAALVEGTAQYRLDYDSPWEKVQEGMSFGEGTQVRTAADSRAVLNIDDGSSVRLNSNSSVILTKLTPRHIIIQNTGGDVYTRVVKSSKRIFQVRTGSATYQSLGTAYRTFNTDTKEGVEVYQSKVSILGVKSDGSVLVEQGKRYFLVDTAATDLEGKVTGLTQAELAADSFLRWNSEQDRKDFADELGVLFDLTAPALEITSPTNGTTTEAASLEVKGTTEKGVKVSVNGASVTNNDGQFTTMVNLNEGTNSIKIEATDQAGNRTVKELSVTRAIPPPPTVFTLSASKTDKGITFSWTISGISIGKGFKLISSKDANPTYPSKNALGVFIDATERSYTWKIQDGQTYHFRICTYDGESCMRYSNDLTVTAPAKQVNGLHFP